MLLALYHRRVLLEVLLALALAMFVLANYGATPPGLEKGGQDARPTLNRPDLLREFLSDQDPPVTDIVFAARRVGDDPHWYANFGHYGPDANRKAYEDGAKLYRLDLGSRTLTTLLTDSTGGIRDPQVHYNGTRILFSYRKGGTPHYLLYEINIDGTGLKQLTDGLFDDIEPTYMPNGDIVFVSSRCKRFVNCWLTQVAVLHKCESDGRNIRAISSNNEHDNTPWPLPDGRLLYTRWEYVDRSQVHFHHLWSANPDGTAQMTWFGNLHPGTTMIDAKPILGSDKVVASFSPGHGQREHDGVVTIVDAKAGPDAKEFAHSISRGAHFRDPWGFSEDCFLAASRNTLVMLNDKGSLQEIFKLPEEDIKAGLQCHEPRPIMRRTREPVIQPRIDLAKATGHLLLDDVNHGRNMAGVKGGEIKKLLVLETLPMPIHYTGGMEPISYGGTFTLERILGTVPIEPDGSAYFEVPAMRSIFFVALDENDISVKRMQSFTSVQPGETTSCIGCHEHRTETPRHLGNRMIALRHGPSKIQPISDVPGVLDFPRDIQPILDRHCNNCHDYADHKGGRVILSGDRGPMFSHSYFTFTARSQVADGRNKPVSNYGPRALGSSASPLMNKLDERHYGVKLSPIEHKTVRLWIDTGAAYPGTYAALGTGMIGHYTENQLERSDVEWPSTKSSVAALKRRCGDCHVNHLALPMSASHEHVRPPWELMEPNDPRRRISRHLLYNLTRPEKSMLLLAPLATDADGWGLCRKPGTTEPAAVFSATSDPDYQAIRLAIADAKKHLDSIKRFDMPGFKPRIDWVREMKRYGILPADVTCDNPIDVYATEKAYWESLWYAPQLNTASN